MAKRGFNIEIIGDQQLITDLQNFKNTLPSARQGYLRKVAEILIDEIRKLAPKDTGNYSNSWIIVSETQDEIVVGPRNYSGSRYGKDGTIGAPQLAVILEYTGAQGHEIKPRNKFALKFQWKGETRFFTKVLNHPGMRPKPHIRPALLITKRKAKGIAWAFLADAMPKRVKPWRDSMERAARAEGYDGGIPPRQTGRNRKDTSANITRGTKGDIRAKLSVGLSGKRLRARGLTRAVGSNESGLKAVRKSAQRIQGQGLERFRQ